MKLASALGSAVLVGGNLLLSGPVLAQQTIEGLGLTVTTTPAALTDYRFRGISQTRNRPAAQLSLDVEHGSGIYVGAFVSNANFAGTNIRQELDGLFGYRFSVGDVKLDIGAVYYGYPGYSRPAGGFEAAWWEGAVRASWQANDALKLLGSVFYSPDFNFESGNAVYVEGGFDLVAEQSGLTLSLRAGYQWIERNVPTATSRTDRGYFGAPDYGVFSIGLSREIAYGVVGAVTASTTTLDRADCFGGAKICGTTVVLSLSRPF
ncbi:TorF family putative porin [Falsiroseomonas oryziterrae]|uniref:TorF family putative porin n=1 Tax=Falsiroseomonas oryziterrae TaxID=2911368 RepID=UPI001F02BA39|nr:TorF family putative porin [Roseomonas sp. NPKOSM-4]